MRDREGVVLSTHFGDQLDLLYPIIETGGSHSAALDNVLELLVPKVWQGNEHMEPEKRAFYNWAACLQKPWDGSTLFAFSDGMTGIIVELCTRDKTEELENMLEADVKEFASCSLRALAVAYEEPAGDDPDANGVELSGLLRPLAL